MATLEDFAHTFLRAASLRLENSMKLTAWGYSVPLALVLAACSGRARVTARARA